MRQFDEGVEENVHCIPSRFLCRPQHLSHNVSPLLLSNVSLSFWGGIDPLSGNVVDSNHPLHGRSVSQHILCLPSGRGSCTASQVLLELILNDLAPTAIVLRDVDGLVTVGALIAQQVFDRNDLAVVCVGPQGFDALWQAQQQQNDDTTLYGGLSMLGDLYVSSNVNAVEMSLQQHASSSMDHLTKDRHDTVDRINSEKLRKQVQQLEEVCQNDAERMALRVLEHYANIVGAASLVPVVSSHIDGCTYIGPGGLAFVRRLVAANGQVKVPTTLNAVSTDRQQWQALGVPADYAQNAIALGDAYVQLQCQPSFTCAPYLLLKGDNNLKDHDLCWGESNAVVYANSVLGARTEKYADYLDICCALVGVVPQTGVHLPHNRVPQIVLDATPLVRELHERTSDENEEDPWDGLFAVLGHVCGTVSDGKVPLLVGLQDWAVTRDDLKAFCAAFGTTGTSPLIHIAGITPEALDDTIVDEWMAKVSDNVVPISLHHVQETFRQLDKDRDQSPKVDLIALGNPHLSLSECETMAQLIDQQQQETSDTMAAVQKHESVRVVACMSRQLYQQVPRATKECLERFGVEFVHDTCWCMLLDPLTNNNQAATVTNSGKYAHYGPALTQRPFRFANTAECLHVARTGRLPAQRAPWMTTTPSRRFYTTMARHLVRKFPR